MAWARVAALSGMLVAAACVYDWDRFDPRLGSGGAGGGASASAASTGSGGAATTSTAAMGGSGGTRGIETVEYVASVAECIDPTALMPDPDVCEAVTALNNMKVDAADAVTGEPSYSYVRFDLDETLAGREVLSVTLRLMTTDDIEAPGISTGELWEVASFTRPDLYVAAPQQLGSAPLAADEGPAAANAIVEYAVPVQYAQPNAGVFLSLVPTSTDGVNYWNTEGVTPPVLSVDYR